MTEDDATNKMGKYFIWIAWIIALAILVFIFQAALEKQWNPNTNPNYALNDTGKAEVYLQRNKQGHYIAQGTLNEHEVTFLLDTGATTVSIPEHIAAQLGLQKFGRYPVQTANGTVHVYQTKVEQLSIGNLFFNNVDAHINPGMKSDVILLGMSVLKRVEFNQTGNQLILREQ